MRARPRALREHVRSQLIGGYKIGDEGVAAQRIDVVKNGVLKTLLTSRIPSANNQTSNGHARRTADGGAFRGSAANLFVTGAARCRARRSINGWSRPPPARGASSTAS
jgi:hypothetical protein